ncbi:MAG: DUF1844 domain-containing protein [Acidimicrobiia bacterium]|nr:DUF1844 domain-containing protein [Acidimicrobiia bacterium]
MSDHFPSPDPSTEAGEPEALSFLAFVISLAHTAAVHFGDAPDPATGQPAAPNLPGARQMIDILALLDEKTRGNLTPEERQVLDDLLYELRMRYVSALGEPRIIRP